MLVRALNWLQEKQTSVMVESLSQKLVRDLGDVSTVGQGLPAALPVCDDPVLAVI